MMVDQRIRLVDSSSTMGQNLVGLMCEGSIHIYIYNMNINVGNPFKHKTRQALVVT